MSHQIFGNEMKQIPGAGSRLPLLRALSTRERISILTHQSHNREITLSLHLEQYFFLLEARAPRDDLTLIAKRDMPLCIMLADAGYDVLMPTQSFPLLSRLLIDFSWKRRSAHLSTVNLIRMMTNDIGMGHKRCR